MPAAGDRGVDATRTSRAEGGGAGPNAGAGGPTGAGPSGRVGVAEEEGSWIESAGGVPLSLASDGTLCGGEKIDAGAKATASGDSAMI